MANKKQRFELKDDTSAKFWEIEIVGKKQTVCFGRIGSSGQTRTKTFDSSTEAIESCDKLIRQKTSKGYRKKTKRNAATTSRKKSNKKTKPAKSSVLDSRIYDISKQLGAKIGQTRSLPKGGSDCPTFIAEFFQSIVWPKKKCYSANGFATDVAGEFIAIPPELLEEVKAAKTSTHNGICWRPIESVNIPGGLNYCSDEELTDYFEIPEEMNLYFWGSHGGGNWLLGFDGKDKIASNPMVYEIDHEGGAPNELCRLIDFLNLLKSA